MKQKTLLKEGKKFVLKCGKLFYQGDDSLTEDRKKAKEFGGQYLNGTMWDWWKEWEAVPA